MSSKYYAQSTIIHQPSSQPQSRASSSDSRTTSSSNRSYTDSRSMTDSTSTGSSTSTRVSYHRAPENQADDYFMTSTQSRSGQVIHNHKARRYDPAEPISDRDFTYEDSKRARLEQREREREEFRKRWNGGSN